MDFIKTSSLRALIELTFQRNWNGLIWMSRKGVITKRVKTVQTALSRISAQPRSPAGRGTMFRARPNHIRPSEVSAKVPKPADHASRPGKCPAVGQATHVTPRRARPCRASREQASRPRNRSYHGRCIRPSRETSHVRPRKSAKSHPPTTPADRIHPATTVPTRPMTRLSGRSSRPTVPTPRSTRSPFEAQTYVFKPGLTLSRL
ncbi:unnamed protein product [Microthlaspi erraticum]|uniref:Uncharacterized protein n=1 Tax=Microthlaspi erraticum TaxID=1685480 RepID=A0A6D2JW51_9BRAS|nr:unnamed protein product [Microthlaspi erraticum]